MRNHTEATCWRNVADAINFDWGKIRKSLMDGAVFELNFGEIESEWTESKEEHSKETVLHLWLSVVLEKQGWGMGYATELRANEPGEVIWCGIKDNSECLVKEFRFTRGKAFELKFDVIQHVF